ncbi:MAG: HAMP domain-containing sensor histidine kinase [Fulvivirga sp.]|uniref:sensor histidine kinase n=1 Tax=Fulvivirga sp. TaxID=1931237 RepID=UPI0032F07A42
MGALKLKKDVSLEDEINSEIYYEQKYISYLKDYLNGVKPDLSIELIDLNKYIQQSIKKSKRFIGDSEIKVSFSIKGSSKFYSNPYYIEFIFDQIIENGVLFHDDLKKEPFLDIELVVDKDKLMVEYVDNGIGIPDDQINYIFNMYCWLSEKSKGYGIGLTLVKQFVENMAGKIFFNSSAGVGSHIQIQIPNAFAF